MSWQDRFSLAGKRALVTGASKGIGAEIAKLYAEAGADVALVARDPDGLAETAAAVRAFGREALVIAAEMAEADGPGKAAKTVLAHWGCVDILVNAAGVARLNPALEVSLAQWDESMAVNLRAPFLLSQALAPAMIAKGGGKIVMISSQAGVVALQDHAAYCTSKGALNMLTKSLCAEWARHNIQVNAICPTVVLTPMGREVWGAPEKGDPMRLATPAQRFAEPVEIADAALFVASSASNMVNGDLLMVEGGYTCV